MKNFCEFVKGYEMSRKLRNNARQAPHRMRGLRFRVSCVCFLFEVSLTARKRLTIKEETTKAFKLFCKTHVQMLCAFIFYAFFNIANCYINYTYNFLTKTLKIIAKSYFSLLFLFTQIHSFFFVPSVSVQ